jgi:hypothetical protein
MSSPFVVDITLCVMFGQNPRSDHFAWDGSTIARGVYDPPKHSSQKCLVP